MQIKISPGIICVLLVSGFSLLFFPGCQKEDINSSAGDNTTSKKNAHPHSNEQESAEFVYEWYELLAKIQLSEPASSPLVGYRNFAYIGVGLFESVQPGIKGGSSFFLFFYRSPRGL